MIQALLASALLLPATDVELAHDPVIVPMTHATKHATVTVRVNGKGPYLFQVDTYSSGDGSVDDDLARELGLVKSGTVLSSDGHTTVTKDLVSVDELRLGGATWKGLVLTVNDYAWIKRSDGKKVSGILGFASFRELLLTFDYPGNRLILSRADRVTAEDANTIPFSVADTGSPDIRLTLDCRELVFGIDTGHKAYLCLGKSMAKDLPLHGVPTKMGQLQTHHNSFDYYRAFLDGTLDFGGHPVESVRLQLNEGEGRNLVGYGLLRPYAVSFDQRSGLVRFVRPPLPEAVPLSEEELQRWEGKYAIGKERFAIEREGDALVFRAGDLPPIATIPLGATRLRLASEPVDLLLREHWFRRPSLGIQDHPERRPLEARRVSGQ